MSVEKVPILELEEGGEQSESKPSRQQLRRLGSAALAVIALVAIGLIVVSIGEASPLLRSDTADAEAKFVLEKKSSARSSHKSNPTSRNCSTIAGVALAGVEASNWVWKTCAPKWTEDCSHSGCCSDYGFRCFRKNKNWATCLASCQAKDENNETWTCDVVEPQTPRTPEGCTTLCQDTEGCKQAVYSGDNGGQCYLAKKRYSDVVWAGDASNSSYCGDRHEQKEIRRLVKKVSKQLPFQIEYPLINCSWGGHDCSETKCCNDFICDADFVSCQGFKCYKKDQYFSGCAAKPLEGWDGEVLGGPREHRVLQPASAQVAVQGTSLYCFTVVIRDAPRPKPFWNSEAELTDNWSKLGLHVLRCDGSDILDGVKTTVAEWGSFSNIDMFMDIWQKVGKIGSWKKYDWTVKVDTDAVFFPDRLKLHLDQLRTPRGARVYLENINYKFKFMGAIEILSREALALFLKQGHTCINGKHEGGEDSFLKTCLDGLGVDHQTDGLILRDKYASMNPPCTDGWAVAYHYMKKTHDWSHCFNEVVCGVGKPKKGECDAAIPVPDEISLNDTNVTTTTA